ncbi:MAG: ATP phosphoribosyltransferase regulatory subunit [Clostridia bacterium]|nr:ATP phosphoribosyltransferase regulatory subunit [Clostridia bacterium]
MDKFILSGEEQAVFALRSLYKKYGYAQYKMSKFEEYDLYAKNKDFLVSDNVITFTDTDGKLLALKPDVTLSIIKNDKDNHDSIKKVFYNEHVYRVSKGTKSFKEIMQIGLECVGAVDDYSVIEVLYLASQSLKEISKESVLDISHLGLVKSVLDYAGLTESAKEKVALSLSQKNLQAVQSVAKEQGLDEKKTSLLEKLVTTYGKAEKVEKELGAFCVSGEIEEQVKSLKVVIESLKTLDAIDNVNVDFSVVSDMNYYNGVVFKGFVSGIPTSILSGGQYDNLMQKMGKKSKAIGFAVYLDEIDRLYENKGQFNVDVAVKYEGASVDAVNKVVKEQIAKGKTVFAGKVLPETLKYKELVVLEGK